MLCAVCIQARVQGTWSTVASSSFRTDSLHQHEKSEIHVVASKHIPDLVPIKEALSDSKHPTFVAIKRAFQCIYYLVQHEIAQEKYVSLTDFVIFFRVSAKKA